MRHQHLGRAIVFSIAGLGIGPVSTAQTSTQAATPPAKSAVQDPAKAEALSAAVRRGDLTAVKQLLDAGVDVNSKFRYNSTAIAFASDRGFADIVKLLIERGADVNAKDTFYDATPITWAASPARARTPGHVEVVRLLLKAGATGGDQALAAAVSEGNVPVVKVILDHGGLPAETLTAALESAKAAKAAEIVGLLEAVGAKPAPEVRLTVEQLARYEGTYESADGQVIVKAVDGRLVLDGSRLGAPPDLALTPHSETQFAAPAIAGLNVTFQIENDTIINMSVGGSTFTKRRGEQ